MGKTFQSGGGRKEGRNDRKKWVIKNHADTGKEMHCSGGGGGKARLELEQRRTFKRGGQVAGGKTFQSFLRRDTGRLQ